MWPHSGCWFLGRPVLWGGCMWLRGFTCLAFYTLTENEKKTPATCNTQAFSFLFALGTRFANFLRKQSCGPSACDVTLSLSLSVLARGKFHSLDATIFKHGGGQVGCRSHLEAFRPTRSFIWPYPSRLLLRPCQINDSNEAGAPAGA